MLQFKDLVLYVFQHVAKRPIRILRLPDYGIEFVLTRLLRGSARTSHFGIIEAICYSWRISKWQRYSIVAEEIKSMREDSYSILDVGGAEEWGIAKFLDPERYDICLLDSRKPVLALDVIKRDRINIVIANGCTLPFQDNSFDIVISVHTLEHIPNIDKKEFMDELKRVAKKKVLINTPAVSNDGKFQADKCDARFRAFERKLFGTENHFLLEHIRSGLPRVEDFEIVFPNSKLIGNQNCGVWYINNALGAIPYIRFLAGLICISSLKRSAERAPYYGCLMIYDKVAKKEALVEQS